MLKRPLFLLSLFALSVMPLSALAISAAPAILIFGDSLSAGYGIGIEQSWPSLLAKRLEHNRPAYTVSNASISGETTAGGRARFDATLARVHPSIVVIALGANDGLRGLPVPQMRDNLTTMVQAAKRAKARVLLIGMKLPPNYGPDYAHQFDQVFVDISQTEKVPLLPFLLQPLGTTTDAFQPDGLHPTASAQLKILDHVWPALQPLVR